MLLPERNARVIVRCCLEAHALDSICSEPFFDLREQCGGNSEAPELFENVHRDDVAVFIAAGADAKTDDLRRTIAAFRALARLSRCAALADFCNNTFGAGESQIRAHIRPRIRRVRRVADLYIQVFEPVSVEETNAIWYGTMIVYDGSVPADAVTDINALRMRTQEGFPNFGEVDDIANFEQIQRGLMAPEDEWVYMNRGFGIPDRIKTHDDGSITAPATDEAFMREHFKEWKRLMKERPNLAIQREP